MNCSRLMRYGHLLLVDRCAKCPLDSDTCLWNKDRSSSSKEAIAVCGIAKGNGRNGSKIRVPDFKSGPS